MSFRNAHALFQDVLSAIDEIHAYLGDFDRIAYLETPLVRRAIERTLQIITEAAARLGPEADVLCPGPDWRNIRNLGNVLRHAYDFVDSEKIWVVLERDIPLLEQAVREALSRLPPEE